MKILKDYFHFSRKDRIGVLALVLLILLTYFIPSLFSSSSDSPPKETAFFKTADSLERASSNSSPKPEQKIKFSDKGFNNGALFSFDPNILDSSGWLKLGLEPSHIKTILHYRIKGGRFYKIEDLQKIWGLPTAFYERVKPYIKITEVKTAKSFEVKTRPTVKILDINDADSATFESLPLIGPVLSARIIKFRKKLGGFVSVDQIKETYGITDSVFTVIKPFLKVNSDGIKLNKVNINTATKEQLKSHPYIKWNLANAIVEYRNQHGMYVQLSDLKKIPIITDDVYTKLMPYLRVQ
jgi:DNA uptake protein and related DNA-binding proteins